MVAIRETKNKSAPPYCELGDLEHFKQNSRNPVNNIDFRVSISFQITYTCISSEARGLTVAKNPQKRKAANWFLWVCSAATVVEKTSGLSCQTKCVWKSSCWRVDVKKIRRTKQGTMKLTKNGNKNIQCQKQGEKSPFFLGGNKTTNIWRKKKDSKFAGTPKNAKKRVQNGGQMVRAKPGLQKPIQPWEKLNTSAAGSDIVLAAKISGAAKPGTPRATGMGPALTGTAKSKPANLSSCRWEGRRSREASPVKSEALG